MARADTKTLLPLDTFAKILGIHPLHFNQVYLDTLAPARVCGTPLIQYAWQEADRTGRDEIAQAVAQAEDMIAREIGFKLLPTWELDDHTRFIQAANTSLVNAYGINARGIWQAIQTHWGYVYQGGIEAKSLICANSAIVFSDIDGDGYTETATITCNTTVTDPEEIAIYYPGSNGDDAWEIRPINVVIAGGVATITCRRELLVMSDLMEAFQPTGVDGLVDANFLDEVDVYRHYTDSSQQVQFLWEPGPGVCNCGLSTCAICSQTTQYGCTFVRDHRLGFLGVTPGTWNGSGFDYVSYTGNRQPDSCRIWYRAGWRDPKQNTPMITMDPNFARAVTYLAVSLLDRPLCNCDHIKAISTHWQSDFSIINRDHSYRVDKAVLQNPLGTTRGAQYAWRLVQKYKIGESVTYA